MNVVLFTVDEPLLNNPCVFRLCEELQGTIRGIVDCKGFHSRRRSIATALILGPSGLARLAWRRVFRPQQSLSDHCRQNDLPYLQTDDINSQAVLDFCDTLEADAIVSLVLAQKIKKELLARFPAINVHFADLPNYRGIFPVFWALHEGEKRVGISAHEIIQQFDKGKVIARDYVEVKRGTGSFLPTMDSCFERTPALIAKALGFLDPATRDDYALPEGREEDGSYHSTPGLGDILRYHLNSDSEIDCAGSAAELGGDSGSGN